MEGHALKVAIGLKAHSGWAALVALGGRGDALEVLDRRRIELAPPAEAYWARQPYHAAEGLDPDEARAVVRRGIESARRLALREIEAAIQRERAARRSVAACAVLVGAGMPDWSVAEILAVHFRMHKAEGELFRDALLRAARACELRLVAIPEKSLLEHAESALGAPATELAAEVAALGKTVGPPWGKDQKDAALAARVALHG